MCPGPDERVSFQRSEREAAGKQAAALERIADALEYLVERQKKLDEPKPAKGAKADGER